MVKSVIGDVDVEDWSSVGTFARCGTYLAVKRKHERSTYVPEPYTISPLIINEPYKRKKKQRLLTRSCRAHINADKDKVNIHSPRSIKLNRPNPSSNLCKASLIAVRCILLNRTSFRSTTILLKGCPRLCRIPLRRRKAAGGSVKSHLIVHSHVDVF